MKLESSICQYCNKVFRLKAHLLQHVCKHICSKKLLSKWIHRTRSPRSRWGKKKSYFFRKKKYLAASKRRSNKAKVSAFFKNLHKEFSGTKDLPEPEKSSSKSVNQKDSNSGFKIKDVIVKLKKIDANLETQKQPCKQGDLSNSFDAVCNQNIESMSTSEQHQHTKPCSDPTACKFLDTAVVRVKRLSFTFSQRVPQLKKYCKVKGANSEGDGSAFQGQVKVRSRSQPQSQSAPSSPVKEEYTSVCKNMSVCIPKLKLHIKTEGTASVQSKTVTMVTKDKLPSEVTRSRSVFPKQTPEGSLMQDHISFESSRQAKRSPNPRFESSHIHNMCKSLRICIPKVRVGSAYVSNSSSSLSLPVIGSGQLPVIDSGQLPVIDSGQSQAEMVLQENSGHKTDQESLTEQPRAESMDTEESYLGNPDTKQCLIKTENRWGNLCKDVKICLLRINPNTSQSAQNTRSAAVSTNMNPDVPWSPHNRSAMSTTMKPVVKLHRISPTFAHGGLTASKISDSPTVVHPGLTSGQIPDTDRPVQDVSSSLSESLNRLHIGSSHCHRAPSLSGGACLERAPPGGNAPIMVTDDNSLEDEVNHSRWRMSGPFHNCSNNTDSYSTHNLHSNIYDRATSSGERAHGESVTTEGCSPFTTQQIHLRTQQSHQLPQQPDQARQDTIAAHLASEHPLQSESNTPQAPPIIPQPALPRLAITLDRVNVEEFYLNNPARRGLGLPVQYVLDQQRPLPQPRVNRNTQVIAVNA